MLLTILDNLDAIFGAILALKVFALIIVNATDTPIDNLWVGRFYRFIEVIAGIWTAKAKQ